MRYLFKCSKMTTFFMPPDTLELDTTDKVLTYLQAYYPDAEIVMTDPTDEEIADYFDKDTDVKLTEALPVAVKAETTRRITEYLSANTRDNAVSGFVIAMAGDPKFESKEAQFMREFVLAGNSWIVEMRAVCQKLIKDNLSTFRDDEHWPKVPAIVADNYKKF